MLIKVRYPDGNTRMVRPPLLNQLIETRKIVEFRRSDGWARLGADPIRHRRRPEYAGPERRDGTTVKLHQL